MLTTYYYLKLLLVVNVVCLDYCVNKNNRHYIHAHEGHGFTAICINNDCSLSNDKS